MYLRALQSHHQSDHLLLSQGPLETIDFQINKRNTRCRVKEVVYADDGTNTTKPRAVLSPGQSLFVAERYINIDDKRGIQPFMSIDNNIHLYPVVHKVAPFVSFPSAIISP